ncbi:kinesin light [Stagonosporopsis vannaccii]|nr:kinesin light [Stagonosporopsis vannaccii]
MFKVRIVAGGPLVDRPVRRLVHGSALGPPSGSSPSEAMVACGGLAVGGCVMYCGGSRVRIGEAGLKFASSFQFTYCCPDLLEDLGALFHHVAAASASQDWDENRVGNFKHATTLAFYTLGRIYNHNMAITCLPGSIGTQSAATVAARIRSRFTNIRFGLMVGIGGGVPSIDLDIRLGDVVVIYPYQQHRDVVQYDFGKTMTKGHIRTGWLNAPPSVLLSAIIEQRFRNIATQAMGRWRTGCTIMIRAMFAQDEAHRQDASDEGNNAYSDKDGCLLSDAETERVAVQRRQVHDDEPQPRKPRAFQRKMTTAGDIYDPRDRDRYPSPAPRRRYRQPRDIRDHYAEANIPTQPILDPLFPAYQAGQRQPQPYCAEPYHVHQQGNYATQPSYEGRYNRSNGAIPQAYPPQPPPTEHGVRYRDGSYDEFGRFVRYGDGAPQSVPPYNSWSNQTLPSTSWPGPNEYGSFTGSLLEEFLRRAGYDHDRPEGKKPAKDRSSSQMRPNEVTVVEKSLAVTLEDIFNGIFKKMKIKRKTYDQNRAGIDARTYPRDTH